MTLTVKHDLFWSNVRALAKFRNKSEHTWSYKTPQIFQSSFLITLLSIIVWFLLNFLPIFKFLVSFSCLRVERVFLLLKFCWSLTCLKGCTLAMFHDHQVSAVKVTSKFYSVRKQAVRTSTSERTEGGIRNIVYVVSERPLIRQTFWITFKLPLIIRVIDIQI